ncbi:uncharacterized protein LOC108465011 [Gossypium arboreum]|uniref:uncharacterized protein LOC108465011 n=1 Tax=Gossypium arboreum TaxID=29729 RepID=UPI000819713C|nr:uncharacterized protein LOC108465011 [Gossypium arboreum]
MGNLGDRNARMHKKVSKSGKEIVSFVSSYISGLNEIEKRSPKISPTVSKWNNPLDQFVKINFDVAYDGRLCQSTVGIMARNSKGNVLLSCAEIHQQVASAFAAEALVCYKATQIGTDMQWPKIIIEGDSLSIIKKCKVKSPDKSLVGAYIHDIQQLLLKSRNCRFEYIPRIANSLAHILAIETLKKEFYLVGNVPEYVEKQTERDRMREPD